MTATAMSDQEAMMANLNKEETLVRSALAVLLERLGGSMEYTQSEFQAVLLRHGSYRMSGEIDKSGPGEPRIRVSLVPAPTKAGQRSDA